MCSRSSDGAFAARAARARELTAGASSAADLLAFYADLAEYQQRLANQRNRDVEGPALDGSLLGAVDAGWVGRAVRDLVAWLPAMAPPSLRSSAEALCDVTVVEWRELFESYRADPEEAIVRCDAAAMFALEAVIQPIAERLAAHRVSTTAHGPVDSRCPACGGTPVVGVLREEGHGARRRLVCGLCFTEWDYLRVVCVKCGEQRFDALPVFSAEQFPLARVDACDTCRCYLKTIDATKDGRAVPVVDDLATVALDLWAREHGYARVRTNLVRI